MEELDIQETEQKRPKFLKVLCILTFINTGLSLITVLFSMISGPASEEAMLSQKVQMTESISALKEIGSTYWVDYMESAIRLAEEANSNFYLAMGIALIGAILGLVAALQMWKGARLGFHIYIVYSLIGVAGGYAYASAANIHTVNIVTGLIISGIFIFMYSRNLKWMR